MSELVTAAVLLGAAAVQTVALGYAFLRSRRRDLGLWTASWGLVSIFQVGAVLLYASGAHARPTPLATVPVAVAVLVMAGGCFAMLGQRFPWWLWVPVPLGVALAAAATAVGWRDALAVTPLSLATGLVLAVGGLAVVRAAATRGAPARAVGLSVIGLAVNMSLYPLGYDFAFIVPVGYVTQTLLSTATAAAVMVFYLAELQAARVTAEIRLLEAQKLEALGRVAGGVAHDFNTLLTVVLGETHVAREGPCGSCLSAGFLEHVGGAAERAAGLTRKLLAFGRKQEQQLEVFDLCEVVRALEGVLRSIVTETVRLDTILADEPVWIRADRMQVEQVLLNLVVNARDATVPSGRVTVRVALEEGRALLEVTDTGTGMMPDVLRHAIEPFFTTKADTRTGLGLAAVHGVVTQSGGELDISSAPGKGTEVRVRLPVTAPPRSPRPRSAPAPRALGGTVLLAEDEELLRDLLPRALRAAGYRVLTASDGAEALALARERLQEIDILVTDVTMPAVGGLEVARQLWELRPGLRVLFITGYSESQPLTPSGEAAAMLAKPFRPAELVDRLAELVSVEKNS